MNRHSQKNSTIAHRIFVRLQINLISWLIPLTSCPRKNRNIRQKATLASNPLCRIQFSIFLQAKRVLQLAGDVVLGNLHVKSGAGVAQVLTGEDGTLLTDEKSCGICVA